MLCLLGLLRAGVVPLLRLSHMYRYRSILSGLQVLSQVVCVAHRGKLFVAAARVVFLASRGTAARTTASSCDARAQ